MKTLSILLLAIRILKLNLKVIKQLNRGAEPSSLKKDLDLLYTLCQRLLLALKAKVGEEHIKKGTAAAPSRAS